MHRELSQRLEQRPLKITSYVLEPKLPGIALNLLAILCLRWFASALVWSKNGSQVPKAPEIQSGTFQSHAGAVRAAKAMLACSQTEKNDQLFRSLSETP